MDGLITGIHQVGLGIIVTEEETLCRAVKVCQIERGCPLVDLFLLEDTGATLHSRKLLVSVSVYLCGKDRREAASAYASCISFII